MRKKKSKKIRKNMNLLLVYILVSLLKVKFVIKFKLLLKKKFLKLKRNNYMIKHLILLLLNLLNKK